MADVFGVQEVLKHGGLVQFLEEVTFFVGIEVGDILGLLETTLQPLSAFWVADVAELAADAFAIGLFEQGDNVFEFGWTCTHFMTGVEGFLQIGGFEAKVLDVEGGGILPALTQGVGF